MPELVFHTGSMDCGGSALALQLDHTQSTHGRQSRIFTSRNRLGRARISPRLGLETLATEVDEEFSLWTHVIAQPVAGRRIDYLVCDETQSYTGGQVEQFARVVGELQIGVYTFGAFTDFRTKSFPGSQRLVELADRVETLPIGPLCWCDAKDTHNVRAIDGLMVTEGSQVVMGDTGAGEIHYKVLCRAYHRRRMIAARTRVTLGENSLSFGK